MTDYVLPRPRVFARRRILQVTEAGFASATRLLAAAIREQLLSISAVVGVAAGGLKPAEALASLLLAPLYSITCQHNPTDALYAEATGRVSCDFRPLAEVLKGQQLAGQILLVDDIVGSGATFHVVCQGLAEYVSAEAVVSTAVLCRNVGAAQKPDFWVWTVDDWVRFPWETELPPGRVAEDLLPPPSALSER